MNIKRVERGKKTQKLVVMDPQSARFIKKTLHEKSDIYSGMIFCY